MPLSDAALKNLEQNKEEWDNRPKWDGPLKYGHSWSGPLHMKEIAENYLLPFLPGRPLNILEISPGAGRFTVELVRVAESMTLIDLSISAIDICRDRFKYYDNFSFYVNDGVSLSSLADDSFDLIASWDSFVHMDKEIIAAYVSQFPAKLKAGGMCWIHHSSYGHLEHGRPEHGWRSNMTADLMREYAAQQGLEVRAQIYRRRANVPPRHYTDCISVLVKH